MIYTETNQRGVPVRPYNFSEIKVNNMWAGPFHCEECAKLQIDFGLVEDDAFKFNHGTPDEVFGVFLTEG